MATADDTAHARPKLHHRAKSHAPTDTPVLTPTMSDVKLAARAIVRVLAQGVASRDPHDSHSRSLLKNPWWEHKPTIEGLSAALSILHEQGDALLRRKCKEDPSA
jgi:hypothetical protein